MPASALEARCQKRLGDLLHAYGREEVWLRVRHWYLLREQPEQACFAVIDAQGTALPDRFGQVHTHTLQLPSSWGPLCSGQLVHLSRAGDGVGVQRFPVPPGRLIDLTDGAPLDQIGA